MDNQATIPAAKHSIHWVNALGIGFVHLGALAAPFFFEWSSVLVAVFLYWLAICCGISMGYHRLLTHRSYEVPKFVEYFFAICGCLTLEGGPISWVATHRLHHQKSDQEGDPHTPGDGSWWAHAGWIFAGEYGDDKMVRRRRYAPDMAKDKVHLWLDEYHWVPLTALAVLLFAIGGWSMMLWGAGLRVVVGLHATWLVNSAAHMWGSRQFDTTDDSRNNWWVALLTFGEGWHNNHHAHPTSARHGLRWYQFDSTWIQLRLLQAIGIVKNLKVPKRLYRETRAAAPIGEPAPGHLG